jgi:hypothetical protein
VLFLRYGKNVSSARKTKKWTDLEKRWNNEAVFLFELDNEFPEIVKHEEK